MKANHDTIKLNAPDCRPDGSKPLYICAMQVPCYRELHDKVSACCGEGESVTPAELGLPSFKPMFDELLLIKLNDCPGAVVYSLNRETSEFCVELVQV